MSRKAKLEKALAFERHSIALEVTSEEIPGVQAMAVSQKLSPLHEALVAAVEALEIMRESLTTEREQRAVVIEKRTREALSKIDKALEEK